jgi:hypothetical protein
MLFSRANKQPFSFSLNFSISNGTPVLTTLSNTGGTGTYCIIHQTEGGLSADYLTAD